MKFLHISMTSSFNVSRSSIKFRAIVKISSAESKSHTALSSPSFSFVLEPIFSGDTSFIFHPAFPPTRSGPRAIKAYKYLPSPLKHGIKFKAIRLYLLATAC